MRTTILLFIISTAIVYGGLLLPQTLLIEEKINIKSSSTHISEYLYDLPKWEQWLNWRNWQGTSDTEYIYSQFPQGVGAFMKFQEKSEKTQNKTTEKAELYIQSISNGDLSNSELRKLKYIANFQTYQAHIEGEFELQSLENNEESTLNFTLAIDLGENPFVRYVAYFYYKPKIEKETNSSLERLKKLCENPVFCKN